MLRSLQLMALTVVILGTQVAVAWARPHAAELFPKETVAFIRITDAVDLKKRLEESSTGRMLDDPDIAPLVEHLYGSAQDAWSENVEEHVGASLDDVLQIPQGEVAVALVARSVGEPVVALLLDVGGDAEVADDLLDRLFEVIRQQGGNEATETIGGVESRVFYDDGRAIVITRHEESLLVTSDQSLTETILANWEGTAPPSPTIGDDEDSAASLGEWTQTLADNGDFISIMRTVRTAGDPPPQITWYADPVEIFRNVSRGNAGAAVALATLPALGLDGFHGVGGSMAFSTDKYDDVSHVHVLLDNPREGVLTLFNLRSGDTTPERWVAADGIDTYITFHWAPSLTYERIGSLVDKFRFEGAWEEMISEGINEEIDIDFKADVIDQLKGRFSVVFGFPQGGAFARTMMLAAEVEDEEKIRDVFKKALAKGGEPGGEVEERTYGNVTYYAVVPPPFRDLPEEERPFWPCFGTFDGHVFACNHVQTLEQCLNARDGNADRLADDIGYKLIASRISRRRDDPGLVMVHRPEVAMKALYDAVQSNRAQDFLSQQSENNPFFSAVSTAMDEHPLPEFEVIAKYFGPSGGIFYDTDNGFHGYSFTLRVDVPEGER